MSKNVEIAFNFLLHFIISALCRDKTTVDSALTDFIVFKLTYTEFPFESEARVKQDKDC